MDLFTDTAADLDPLREERAIAMAEFEKQKKRKDAGMRTQGGLIALERKVRDLDDRILALGGVSLANMLTKDPSDTTLRKGFDLATMGSSKNDPEFARLVAEILRRNQVLLQNNIQNNNNQTILPDVGSINEDASVIKDRTSNY